MPRLLTPPRPLPGQPIERDRARHEAKLADAIRRQLPSVVGQTPVMTSPEGRQAVVRVKALELPHFRRREPGQPGQPSGVGSGPARPGDVLARVPKSGGGETGGSEPGSSTVEVLVDLDTLQTLVMEDLHLPRLTPRAGGDLVEDAPRWTSRRDRGPHQRLDRSATMKAHLRRRLALGRSDLPLSSVDLQYRSWRDRKRPVTQAVVGLVRDVSGSMDREKVYLAHALSWWVVSWLRRQYTEVAVDFWVHHTDAWRVDEEEFFGEASGGGTVAARAYRSLQETWASQFPPSAYNRYVLHFSDGDDADPERAASVVQEAMATVQLWALAELRPRVRSGRTAHSRLGQALWRIGSPVVRVAPMGSRDDVYPTLKVLLGEEDEDAGARVGRVD